jgi:ADP-ribosyl-[dinitrogen reductase] hydrolase
MIEKSKLRGGIYGLLLGDAAGVPYEFNPPGDLAPYADRIDMVPPAGFRRTYSVPVGTWSDDGALALCLLESLAESGGHDPIDQARRMVAWLDEGHLAVDNHVFDVGVATRQALDQARSLLAVGASPVGRGLTHEMSAGNGTLMRILPLALLHDGSDEELVRMAMEHSGLTHAHPLCLACCGIYCLWARHLAGGLDDPFEAAVGKFRGSVRDDPAVVAALRVIEEWEGKTPSGTGFVVDTLYSARHALEAGTDFKGVIRRSILLGNDTDTTAAVAGGLAGVAYGLGGLPEDWMALLRGKEVVESILRRAGFGPP